MDTFEFYNYLLSHKITFFTGVPDSLLKEFNNVIQKNTEPQNHHITANEGSAIALATGYNLATKNIPLVYLQNSGFGNMINPLMSLASDKVYSIPMLIIVGWRGEPGIKDEPQHLSQGECMVDLINSLKIPFNILSNNIDDSKKIIDSTIESIKLTSKPHIILVKKNTFQKYSNKIDIINNYPIYRKEAIEHVVNFFNKDIILSTTGKISRELLETINEKKLSQDNIFLNVGAMGHVSMISLGIAMNTKKRVICLDGDGSVLMHMGNLTNIGTSNCSNLIHIVLNNGMHESVGIQPTKGFDINISEIARKCGYSDPIIIDKEDQISNIFNYISSNKLVGPILVEIRINNKVNYSHELARPKDLPIERKNNFIEFISK